MIHWKVECQPPKIGLNVYKDWSSSRGFILRLNKWWVYTFRYSVYRKKLFTGLIFKSRAEYEENQRRYEEVFPPDLFPPTR